MKKVVTLSYTVIFIYLFVFFETCFFCTNGTKYLESRNLSPQKRDKNKLCRHTTNPPSPHVDKHEQFSNPPSPLTCYIVYGWPPRQTSYSKYLMTHNQYFWRHDEIMLVKKDTVVFLKSATDFLKIIVKFLVVAEMK